MEECEKPSSAKSTQLPLTMASSWDALDITTCLSLFNRRVEPALFILLLGCLIHSCQGLPKVGRANEPEKMPAGKRHPFSPPPLSPVCCYLCFDNSTCSLPVSTALKTVLLSKAVMRSWMTDFGKLELLPVDPDAGTCSVSGSQSRPGACSCL